MNYECLNRTIFFKATRWFRHCLRIAIRFLRAFLQELCHYFANAFVVSFFFLFSFLSQSCFSFPVLFRSDLQFLDRIFQSSGKKTYTHLLCSRKFTFTFFYGCSSLNRGLGLVFELILKRWSMKRRKRTSWHCLHRYFLLGPWSW